MIDLGSTNGSFINDQKIEQAKYYELKEKVRERLLSKISLLSH